jgi:hypothetical protein
MCYVILGLTEISIEIVLEIFPKFPSDEEEYDVEGNKDGYWASVEMKV